MNNQQKKRPPVPVESTTTAKVTAKFCCGCEKRECSAASNPTTTRCIPVNVDISTEMPCVHPCETFPLTVIIRNRADCTICNPKLSFTACPGVKFCNIPRLDDIGPGKEITVTVDVTTERIIGACCTIRAVLTFQAEHCCGKAVSDEWLRTVSRTVADLKITKCISPSDCFTPGECVKVTLTVCNPGNVAMQEVCVTDEIPAGMRYEPNSTRIGNMPAFDQNPADGITLECLKPKEQIVITYCMCCAERTEPPRG